MSLLRPQRPFVTPRALETKEIPGIIEAFRRGAQNAQLAGFDGVELHGANGYLLDQFLQDGSNHRTDEYGGSIENRARLHIECAEAAISVFGPGRVGMHLAPRGDAHGISDSNPHATFTYLARELGKRHLAFIAAREHVGPDSIGPTLKQTFGGVFVANEAIDQAVGQRLLDEGKGRRSCLRQAFYRKSRPASPVPEKRTTQPSQPGDLLRFRSRGLHRLSGTGELAGGKARESSIRHKLQP